MDEIWTYMLKMELEINESLYEELVAKRHSITVVKGMHVEYMIAKVASRIEELKEAIKEGKLV